MHFSLFHKIYFADIRHVMAPYNAALYPGIDKLPSNIDVKTVDLQWFCDSIFKTYQHYSFSLIICPDLYDLTILFIRLCKYIGLPLVAANIILKWNAFCLELNSSYNKETFLYDSTTIQPKQWNNIKQTFDIVTNIDMFHAEFFINCVNNPTRYKKYEYFRKYEIFDAIKTIQMHNLLSQSNSLTVLDEFNERGNDAATLLNDPSIFNQVKAYILEHYEKQYGWLFTTSTDEYIKLSKTFSYDYNYPYKFNHHLMRHLQSIKYRIDSNAYNIQETL